MARRLDPLVVRRLDNTHLPLSRQPSEQLIDQPASVLPEDSVWVKREQTTSRLPGYDIPLRERLFSGIVIERGEVLLADCVRTSVKQPFPSHTSHKLQPCNMSVFARLKDVHDIE